MEQMVINAVSLVLLVGCLLFSLAVLVYSGGAPFVQAARVWVGIFQALSVALVARLPTRKGWEIWRDQIRNAFASSASLRDRL